MELKRINKSFTAPVLKELSASFDRGFHILSGANGCGKTTLLKIISGRVLPDSGEISVSPEKVAGVFANSCFYPQLSVLENLEFFLALRGVSNSKAAIEAAAGKAGLPELELNKKTETLSSGNLIKAGLAKMYAEDKDIFIIDEVLSALDEASFKVNMRILREKSQEKIIILVSHQKDRFLSEKAAFWTIRDGKIYNESN